MSTCWVADWLGSGYGPNNTYRLPANGVLTQLAINSAPVLASVAGCDPYHGGYAVPVGRCLLNLQHSVMAVLETLERRTEEGSLFVLRSLSLSLCVPACRLGAHRDRNRYAGFRLHPAPKVETIVRATLFDS